MLKGFKAFIMRGNLIELAVAFVIGAAFARLVQDFIGAIVTPIISALPGSNSNGFGFALRHTAGAPHGSKADLLGTSTFINLSTVINSVVVFVMTALVVYFALIVPMNKYIERKKRGQVAEPTDPTNLELLTEIRDLLASNRV